jgi:hypothetical protein
VSKVKGMKMKISVPKKICYAQYVSEAKYLSTRPGAYSLALHKMRHSIQFDAGKLWG